ncbi:unnamed protein product [Schistosoma margrebowiei]|uniref:Uncharacterized protein n=1 Tax=Schistosoma margrebowiei TaxID=48269 RepID=A0A3P7YJL3_9TREM|nr:unnamed protein product [Schistosoma margrebowiei]
MNRRSSMSVLTSMSDFSASAGMLSGPAAFQYLICLTAILISSFVGGLTSMGRSVCAASILVNSLEPACSGVSRSILPICSAVVEFLLLTCLRFL